MESSAHSLTLTLERTISKIDGLLDKIDRYESAGQLANMAASLDDADVLPDADEEDEEFAVGGRRQSYQLSELDVARWRKDLRQDKDTLDAVLQQVAAIKPERDGKLQEIREAIRDKAENPTLDRDGNPNHKLLVFTTFKDTANYLYGQLDELARELGLNMAMVSGDETRTDTAPNNFNAILSNFAPQARNRAGDGEDIDLLIATDCISEGQNLQDCDTVLNYDIHWNPVRLIQRFGRIDRIGSNSKSVRMLNYWPTNDMDVYLKLESRVQARMAIADLAGSGDEDPFTEADAQLDLNFRDQQLLRLRDEILDLDDLSDSPALGDFTLDHFLTQLLRYLEANRDKLEAMPPGVYAVAPDGAGGEVQPGIVFCLRQRNTAELDSRRRAASPVHPFYLVYLRDDGNIRYGCANARQALGVFEAAAVGHAAPITELCDRFDAETSQGRDMSIYDKMLTDALAHIRQSHAAAQAQGLRAGSSRNFVLQKASEIPNTGTDFELVTWVVIKDAR